jgi:hypothetical protein
MRDTLVEFFLVFFFTVLLGARRKSWQMRSVLTKQEEIAVRIYCAKVMGFYANPVSESPMMEPSYDPCVEDAENLLAALERRALKKLRAVPAATSQGSFNERQAG